MARIQLGVRWPEYDVPIDRGTVRAFLETVEDLGYDHVTTMDHVAGISDATLGRRSHFTEEMEWGESLTMLTYMAGMSDRLGFMPAVLILPARQTALVAKQAATIHRLSEGRFRLGISIGRNHIEYQVLGADFATRARRIEEQIEVLRILWKGKPVQIDREWHHLPEIAIRPRPSEETIPIWMGMSFNPPPAAIRRIAKYADGILPPWPPGEKAAAIIEAIHEAAVANGRGAIDLGIEARINLRQGLGDGTEYAPKKSDEEIAAQITDWAELGATHLEFKSRSAGLNGLDEHLKEIERFKMIADSVLRD